MQNIKENGVLNQTLLEFKIKFIIYVLYMLIAIFSLLTLLYFLDIIKITPLLANLNIGLILLSVIASRLLQKNKKYYRIISHSVIAGLFSVITLNLFTVSADRFAPMWYIPVIIGSYVALEKRDGIIVTILSIIFILLNIDNNHYNLQSLNTLFLSVIAVSIIGYIISDRIKQYDNENREILNRLNNLANIDYLTRVYNRRAFFEVGQKSLSFAKRNSLGACVIMLDIDFFKNINDTYGHKKGDEILKRLANVIKNSIREDDVFGRIGGEEFALVLNNCNKEIGIKVAEKIRKIIEEDEKVIPTISLGLVTNEDNNSYRLDKLLNLADKALYKAKEAGRNRVETI